jgi:hypothetical protein
MLTDIFADRYANRILWPEYTEVEAKLLNQCYRIVAEQLFPYWIDGKESPSARALWVSIHDQLSMELGVDELAPKFYSFSTDWMGKTSTQSGFWTMDKVCKDFVCARYAGQGGDPDRYVKDRISFIELAFRLKEQELQARKATLPERVAQAQLMHGFRSPRQIKLPGEVSDGIRALDDALNVSFRSSVGELNERLRRAGAPLDYHNGFLQIATDARTDKEIEQPFWSVVADPLWKNVDIDMKEALDRRDGNQRDAVFYAARALESTIKIISDKKEWTLGREKGAHSYIDNLGSSKNGAFIAGWEREALKSFFTDLRNPFGHGPGSDEMLKLSEKQTDWAIEACMSWIKSLVGRM